MLENTTSKHGSIKINNNRTIITYHILYYEPHLYWFYQPKKTASLLFGIVYPSKEEKNTTVILEKNIPFPIYMINVTISTAFLSRDDDGDVQLILYSKINDSINQKINFISQSHANISHNTAIIPMQAMLSIL